MVSVSDDVIHFLLVAFSGLVLLISLSALSERRTIRYLFLSLAFTFLMLSQIVELVETLFFSNQLILIPVTGIHLSHFLDFLMLSSLSLALLSKSEGKFGNRERHRVRIKFLVSVLPGIHLRELQRALGVSFNTTRHHVERLAKSGEIVRKEDGGFSRLYPPGIDTKEGALFTIVRGETDRRIIAKLAETPGLSNRQVCDLTGLAKSTASEHLTRLVQFGVVKVSVGVEQGIVYELLDPVQIRLLIRKQDPTLLKKATGRFIDLWDF